MEPPDDRAQKIERWKEFQATLPKVAGTEFLPVPGAIATKEQIAGFWGAVKHWDATEQNRFTTRIGGDEKTIPNSALIELSDKTTGIENHHRTELSMVITDDQIVRGYEAAGRSDDADRCASRLKFLRKTEQEDKAETFRSDEAKAMLKAGYDLERRSFDRERREDYDRATEMTAAKEARLERVRAATFPEVSKELTRPTGRSM